MTEYTIVHTPSQHWNTITMVDDSSLAHVYHDTGRTATLTRANAEMVLQFTAAHPDYTVTAN